MPDTIVRNMHPADNKATIDIIKAEFMENGYGENKARKWIQTYLNIGVFEICGRTPDGKSELTTVWWN